jgi:hypothetical protein
MTTWGVVSMVRGPALDILRFAAHHLDLGADRLYLYLDEPNTEAQHQLEQHPKVQVTLCDDAFWLSRNRTRPGKHQVRQSTHASYTYRKTDLDWLAHIDVDEFLWADAPIPELLETVPADIPAVRVRPIESIAEAENLYKAHIPKGPDREALVQALYPTYGAHVLGGFLSHVQGKLIVRTGLKKLSFRIHNLFQDKTLLPCKFELPGLELCHHHAPSWEHWFKHYRFRMERGSYKPGMSPNLPRDQGGVNKNELFSQIESARGVDGLRAFYAELSAADPDVRARLEAHGQIRHRPLHLDEKVAKHFPGSC